MLFRSSKLKKLEEDLEGLGKKISALTVEREKTLSDVAETQAAVFHKSAQLSSANASLVTLQDKLAPLELALEENKAREEVLSQKLLDMTKQLEAASAAHVGYTWGVELWAERLVNAAEGITAQLSSMDL